jgi:hypothetical protein
MFNELIIFLKFCFIWNLYNQLSSINLKWDGSHVILKAIQHAQQFGLNMITLHFHTSHKL